MLGFVRADFAQAVEDARLEAEGGEGVDAELGEAVTVERGLEVLEGQRVVGDLDSIGERGLVGSSVTSWGGILRGGETNRAESGHGTTGDRGVPEQPASGHFIEASIDRLLQHRFELGV